MTKYATSASTKTLLINASGELAAELGFSNVSTRAIAERSGENIGSIHYHFGSKEALFEEVVKMAIADIITAPSWSSVNSINQKDASPKVLAQIVQKIVHQQIRTLFNPDKPRWHSQVIYQLLQFEGGLYDLFIHEVLEPDMKAMRKFFRIIKPEIPDDEVLLRSLILQMPIFAHANYMSAILKLLDAPYYSDQYLIMMENILVHQTQMILGLPLTESIKTKRENRDEK